MMAGMNALTPSFASAARVDDAAPDRQTDSAEAHWSALSEAAGLVALLAGLEPALRSGLEDDVPALIGAAEPWRRARAEQGLADLSAILEPGIAALVAVNARGADPRPAARALWHEFAAARAAILALLPART